MELTMSALSKTWIFDLDGTLVRHNGYKNGGDVFLPGAREFLLSIPENDYVLLLTARSAADAAGTKAFLAANRIRYNQIVFDVPMGERILFNDSKPSGLKMSYAVECVRDQGLQSLKICVDENL